MQHPIQWIESLKTLAQVAIAWTVIMGIWPMTPEQQALTITLAIAAINFFGGIIERAHTTPLANPKAADGEPLVRKSGSTRSAMGG